MEPQTIVDLLMLSPNKINEQVDEGLYIAEEDLVNGLTFFIKTKNNLTNVPITLWLLIGAKILEIIEEKNSYVNKLHTFLFTDGKLNFQMLEDKTMFCYYIRLLCCVIMIEEFSLTRINLKAESLKIECYDHL